jgi:SOS-response transcriptional repressor, LexA
MTDELTPREKQVLEMIKNALRTKGYPPSVREIGQAVGLSSTSTVHSYLRRLEKKGMLSRDPSKPRALEVLHAKELFPHPEIKVLPVLGRVAAGMPLLAIENQEGTLPLPADLTGHGEFFILRVRGDSMVEASILDGDLVVVRRQPTAENGDIVVALIDDEATVKRFFRENNHIRLQPENRSMAPIIAQEVVILGKVTALLRKF